MPLRRLTRPERRALLGAGVTLLGLLAVAQVAVERYADLAWFRSLGYGSRFWRLELARGVAWLAVVAGAGGAVYAVLWGIGRRIGPIRVRRRLGDLVIAEALPSRRVRLAAAGLALLAALLVAAPVAGTLGERALLLAHARAWGWRDPVLGRDPGFYVFLLPVLRAGWSLFVSFLLWIGLAVLAVFSSTGRIQTGPRSLRIEPFARRWLAGLGAGALLLLAAHFALSALETVSAGPIRYATVHGEIPARRLAAVLALLAAVLLPVAERTGRWKLAISSAGAVGAAWIGVAVYPDVIQRFRVEPNELELERPFLAASVASTRRAFAVDGVSERPYPVTDRPPGAEVVRRWTAGLPLWDERPLRATYDQLQGLLAYHEFPDVDDDRYGPAGAREQVAIAVRELAPARIAPSARTWQNLHVRYAYGQGVVVSPVDRVAPGGEPHYFVRDLPPVVAPGAPPGVEVSEPRVYFGERTTQYVLLPRDSIPPGSAPPGVPLSGARRVALAWALGSKNVLLHDDGAGAVLLWHRQVVERTQRLMPFLAVDPDPLPVLVAGRVVWLLDLYAVSGHYPLAARTRLRERTVSYARDAAKAVVDGLTGEVSFYAVAPDDPIVATLAAAFPGVFRDLSALPAVLRAHLRYPRALLRAQAAVLEAYHLVDPEAFYRGQDLWSVAREVYGEQTVPVEPYYLLMPFPGGAGEPEFLLTVPFTPRNRDNLVGFLLARSDGEAYGELALFRTSAERQVFGPRQVEVQIEQDPVISQQLSLWRQLGSRATRGHLLLVPIEGFLLYVEPLYLEAEDAEGAAPGLRRVIAFAGDRVAMGESLEEALGRLLGAEGPGRSRAAAEPVGEDATPRGPAVAPDALVARLRAADEALRRGDLSGFAAAWEEVRAWLRAEAAPGTPAGEARE